MQAVAVDSQPLRSDGLYQLPFASGNSWTADLRARGQLVCLPVADTATDCKPPAINSLSRRCSYEEVVHPEMAPESNSTNGVRNSDPNENKGVQDCILKITQWAVTLKEVIEDRSRAGIIGMPHVDRLRKCVCFKAQIIENQLKNLESRFVEALDTPDSPNTEKMTDLWTALQAVQDALRMNVSIQISNPGPEAVTRSTFILREITDPMKYVTDLISTLVTFSGDLLLVKACPRHLGKHSNGLMEQDEEEDIRSRVASLMTDTADCSSSSDDFDEDDDVDMDDMDGDSSDWSTNMGRKRKQVIPRPVLPLSLQLPLATTNLRPRRTPPTSPTSSASSPSKRPRRLMKPSLLSSASQPTPVQSDSSLPSSPALELLESKKKGQRSGLYQWVLWREALKGEKDRRSSYSESMTLSPMKMDISQTKPPDKTTWRKLSFS